MQIRMGTISGSNFIKAVGFSGVAGDTATLRIRFDDATIDFVKVPFAIFKALVRSRSPAHFYLRNIYGNFQYEKI
jgi:KTSC domain